MVSTICVIADSNTFFNKFLVNTVKETNYKNMMHCLILSWLIQNNNRLRSFFSFPYKIAYLTA